MQKDNSPQLVTPTSVKAIISRIEAAQLTRAQEGISTQLADILDNVNGVINRFQEELGYNLKEKAKSHQKEQKGKNRFILLEKIASFSKDAKTKEKHLYEILRWLGDWGDSLTYEIRNRKSEKEEEALDEWIEVMEKVLPLSLIATKGGIESLISLCSTLIEEQKKKTQMSKRTFWQGWREKSPQKSPPEPQPLSPEEMLQDKQTTCSRVSEVKSMLQELLDSTMFNKGEVRAIRYMSAVVENLNKALILQHQENRTLETKYRYMKIEMTKELSSQRLYFQKSLKILENKRDALLKQVEILGGKYHDLLLIKHALEFQLKKAQSARGQAEDLVKTFVDIPGPPEKETLPKKEIVMELPTKVLVSQQEPKKEEQLFLPHSPSPMATAWDSDGTPSAYQPLSTMATHSRIADVYRSKDIESLPPASPPSVDYKFPETGERPVEERLDHKDEDQEDLFQEEAQEKGELQVKVNFRKQQSPESSRKVSSESEEGPWEEEFSWQRRRQQWLEEEEMWLQRQKKWFLQEQEHQEKLRQWEMEETVREQRQRFIQPEKEQESPRRESEKPREDIERMIFMPTSRWRELEKAEPSLAPPSSRVQSARQGRRSYLPRSPSIPQSAPGSQRTVSSAEPALKPRTSRVRTKPKKSSSFPVTGTSIRKVTRPSLQASLVSPKEKVYRMDMEAQRKNLEILNKEAELGLPHYLRNKALELTTTTMELNLLRLQYLCHKYATYRRFQRLRQEVINHIQVMRITGATYKAQSLYIFLENIDRLQNLRLQTWTKKQKDLEEKRRECLSSMVTIFPKLQLEWNVHLNTPVVTSPKPRKSKSPPAFPRHIRSSGPSCKKPLEHFMSKQRECVPLRMARHQGSQMEAVWKTDVASSSHPIEKKTPPSLQWDQLGGYPDIPRLLALDVHSSYQKSLTSLKTCASTTQRKESQESTDESAELVHKKSSDSLPGTLKKQKDQDSTSPNPIP
ncbi:protein FAM186B isoform X1 [Elephas maximus indicus]|uniref:protein FAM186B isoform X1 n=1 Tax=Elephas maximus indicus TaxID=99487 RepID=UPI00211621C7|nr:protein FAM186B isoform X1 [Elephas maximus indicus]XP_049738999.1 protein FAM186B isoform X1 [Elephas maximus indicus]